MCLPVLFAEIAGDLGLSLVQIGLVWGIGSLPGMLAAVALVGRVAAGSVFLRIDFSRHQRRLALGTISAK